MSSERIKLIKAYGAKVVLSSSKLGMKGSVEKAEELAKTYENKFIPVQFDNLSNPEIYYKTTGPEIDKSINKKVDIFDGGFGTGGTISGVGRYLKEMNKNIKIIGVEPQASSLVTQGKAGLHKIQGIGANFVPKNLHKKYVDEFLTAYNEESFEFARVLGKYEGISSGAALSAANKVAERNEKNGKNIVALLPDSVDRYLSTYLFNI